ARTPVAMQDAGHRERQHLAEDPECDHTCCRGEDTYGGCFPARPFSSWRLSAAVKHYSRISPLFFLPTALECLRRVEQENPGASLIHRPCVPGQPAFEAL